jgi:hypothetical protein
MSFIIRTNVITVFLIAGLLSTSLRMMATSPNEEVCPVEKSDTSILTYRNNISFSTMLAGQNPVMNQYHFDMQMNLSNKQATIYANDALSLYRNESWSNKLIQMASSYGIIDMDYIKSSYRDIKNNYQDLLETRLSAIGNNWLEETGLIETYIPSDKILRRSGFENLWIGPSLSSGATGIRCTYLLNFGKISSFWNMEKQNLSIKVQIPLFKLPRGITPASGSEYIINGGSRYLTSGTKTELPSESSVAYPLPSQSIPVFLDAPAAADR